MLTPYRRVLAAPQSPLVGVLVLLCTWCQACAEEDTVPTILQEERDASMQDMPRMPEDLSPELDMPALPLMDQGSADMPDAPVDAAPDASQDIDMAPPLQISYALCALGQRAPWGDCLPDDTLAFGRVPAAQQVSQLARIDNDGDLSVEITKAMFSQAEYQVTWLTYDRSLPAVAQDAELPFTLEPGESLFAQVSLFGGLVMATLPNTQLEISVDTGEPALEVLTLELSALYEGCALGLASCDMDDSNGCEINISTDVAHCGACAQPCSLDNATPQCAGSNCLVASCDQGFGDCDGSHANGCEVDTLDSLAHCGGCDQLCDFANAQATCDQGSCTFNGCLLSFDDCDGDLDTGCEVNINSDPAHCGGCDQLCDYDNAQESCMQGVCSFQGCEPGYYDLNNDLSDGCEYSCTFQSPTDLPDPQYIDANCDGIDGLLSEAVFVSTQGSDAAAGTRGAPFRSVGKALNVAATTSGISQVLVASGSYEEQVFLVNGVNLAGGYVQTDAWSRSPSAISRTHWRQAMSTRVIAMSAQNISSPTLVTQMTVEAEDTSATGTSTYGLHCRSCSALSLVDNTFIAGDAGAGLSGTNGSDGATNSSSSGIGKDGKNGSCNSNPNNAGGARGLSACGRHGGNGGEGGDEGDNDGDAGDNGIVDTPAGAGGSGGSTGSPGSQGTNGANGAIGTAGTAGSGGFIQGSFWTTRSGNNGGNGEHGNGGGGGGGGGGEGCFLLCNDGAGNGGGGGGAAGCGGGQGSGGGGGGSSFAAFLYQSTGITLIGNSMRAGNGGAGGRGGTGGSGSAGMAGGRGAVECTEDVGAGGNGGTGGSGGRGGHGGGGSGGHSYAIWREQTTVGLPSGNTLTFGQAGSGGISQGNNGSAGDSGTYK